MARTKRTRMKSRSGSRYKRAVKMDIIGNSTNSDGSDTDNENVVSHVEQITELLLSLKETPIKFATDGILKGSPLSGLDIEGIGPIPLPLCSDQAKKIIAVASQALFGLSEETSKTWSLHPDQFTLKNPQFHASLKSVISKVKVELGCDSKNVEANLSKLLLYEKGGHFKPHRDSEKEDGMFATLIIQLPSVFKGNNLIVRHGGQAKIVDFDVKESEYEMIYAAHYADCEHEITPLQSGYRIALIYNLVWTASTEQPPSVDQNKWTINNLTFLLPKVVAEYKNVFGFSLEHKYNSISLENGIKALKGKDRTIAVSLQTANKELKKDEQFTFYIVKIRRETMESDHEGLEDCPFKPWVEVEEDSTTLTSAYDFKGKQHNLEKIAFHIREDLLDFKTSYNSDSDEFWGDYEVEGPTGNKGSLRNRWYNNYIILAIPENRKFKLLCKAGFKGALDHLYDEFNSSSTEFKEDLKTFLNEFSASSYSEDKHSFLKVVEMLQKTCDSEHINLFIVNVLQEQPSPSFYWTNEKKIVLGLHFEGTEQIISDLFKSVDWPSIKLSVEKLIEISLTVQYDRWFKLHSTSGINDICHKLIEVILLKLKAKEWSPSEEDHTVFVQLFEAVFKCEELSNRWWKEISSCVKITRNINLLAKILARLPADSEPNKYTFIIQSFVYCLNQALDLAANVEKYSSLIFAVIKPIITYKECKKYLDCLLNCLIKKKCFPIIERVIGLLIDHDQSWSKLPNFQMFLSAFLDWMNVANLNESHSKEVINIAKVLYQQDEFSADDSLRYLTSCKKISNVKLLCSVITKLNVILNKNDVSNRSHIIKSLLSALLALLSKYNVSQQPTTGLLDVLLIMFKERSEYGDILSSFMAYKYVTSSISLLGGVIKSLCSDKENFDSLKTDLNFQSILVNYIRLFKQQETVVDFSSLSNTLSFLFTDESWCMERCIDLNGLITAGCLQNDFKTCAGVIDQIPIYHSDNYKNLLLVAVKALECSNNIEQGVDYDLILEFVKYLLRDQIACENAISSFSSLNQLKVNDQANMYSTSKSVLKKLIVDLKSQYGSTETYKMLVLLRVENLQRIKSNGPPKPTNEQPNAVIVGHPQVQTFLRGPQQRFTYRNFTGIAQVRRWVSQHFSLLERTQITKGYCCSVDIVGSGRNACAVLTKIPFYDKAYDGLMKELQILLPYIPLKTTSKRHQPMISGTVAKKVLKF